MHTFIYKALVTLLITTTTIPIFGQIAIPITPDQSVVSMSEDDLTALTKTLKKHKRVKKIETLHTSKVHDDTLTKNSFEVAHLRNRITELEQLLTQSSITQNGNASHQGAANYNTDRYTQDQLDELRNLIQQMGAKSTQAPIVITTPNTSKEREIVIPSSTADKTPHTDTTNIQQKIDSLYTVIAANKAPETKNYTNDFEALQNKLEVLQNELATKKAEPTDYEVLKSRYANYSQNIYFSNNSKALNIQANQIIDELVQTLATNDKIDIIVKGFASDQGNPSYNEKLSMERTEEVKRNLMIKGIHPTRVLTQYHGIDYKAPDAINARRVAISLLVRK